MHLYFVLSGALLQTLPRELRARPGSLAVFEGAVLLLGSKREMREGKEGILYKTEDDRRP